MNEQLLLLAIQETPAIIELLRGLFHRQHPDDPIPTSEQVIAAWHSAFLSSLAMDDAWLAAHPPAPPA